ncbi:hypothetical protein [Microvirga calopogonii]|nr:hypothetical protein [Microvirga calopogonii]
MNYDVDPLKAANGSPGNNRSVPALEWIGLLPALGVCAWVILNFG